MEEPLDDYLFEQLKGRLQNYEEDPVEGAWDNIFEAINQEDTPPVGKSPWLSNKWWVFVALLLWMLPSVIQDGSQTVFARKETQKQAEKEKTKNSNRNQEQAQIGGDAPIASEKIAALKEENQGQSNENKPRLPLVGKKDIRQTQNKKRHLADARVNKSNTQRNLPLSRLTLPQPTNITNNMPKDNSPVRTKRKRTSRNTAKSSTTKPVINKVVIKKNAQSDTRKNYKTVTRLGKTDLEYLNYRLTNTKFTPIKEKIIEPKKAKNLYVKLFVSPTYNYRRLLTNKEDDVIIQGVEKNGFLSGNNLGYSAGLMLETQLNKRWSVQWGVTFTQLSDQVNYSFRNALPDSVSIDFISANEIKVSPVFNTETSSFQYQYQDFGVQLGVNYAWFAKSWKHQLYLGIAANQATKTVSKSDDAVITENTSRFQSLLNLGYEARFQFNRRLGFYLKPTLNYYLNSISQANQAYQVKPFFTALRLGLVWRLR